MNECLDFYFQMKWGAVRPNVPQSYITITKQNMMGKSMYMCEALVRGQKVLIPDERMETLEKYIMIKLEFLLSISLKQNREYIDRYCLDGVMGNTIIQVGLCRIEINTSALDMDTKDKYKVFEDEIFEICNI